MEDDVDPPSPPAFMFVNVKQETEDTDESSLIDTHSMELDGFLPPVEQVTVDTLAWKMEHDQDTSRLELQEMETDPLLLPDVEQEDSGEVPMSGQRATSSRIKREPAELQDTKEEEESEEAVLQAQVHSVHQRKCGSEDGLSPHVLSYARDNRGMYHCDHTYASCGESFKYESLLNRHKEKHVDDSSKTFICDHAGCGKSFKSKSYLNRHKEVHVDVCNKAFICDHVACGKDFATVGRLIMHKAIHSKATRFACKKCDYWCMTKTHLQRHMQVHLYRDPQSFPSDQLLFQCSECEKIFVNKSLLAQHIL